MGQKNFFAKVAFLLFLFLFPFGEIVRLPIYPNVSIHPSDIVIGILAICSFSLLRKKTNSYFFRPILLVLGVFFLSLAVHLFTYRPNELFVSVLYYIRFVCSLFFLLILSSFDGTFKKRIPGFLTVLGFIIVLLGYVQYFLYPDLRNLYYAGWDEHLYRMFSTFLDPNFAGAFFVMYFLFLVGMIFQNGKKRVLLYGIAFLTLGAIFLTYSRSAYLMLGVSLIAFFLLQKQKKALFGLLGIVLLLPLLLFFSPKSEGTNLLRTASGFARVAAFDNAITLWRENPVFGVGFNAYRYAQEKHGFFVPKDIENHAGAGTDNSFLFVLATTGITGFLAYIYFWYAVFKKTCKNTVIFATIVGIFVNAFFINSLFYPFLLEFLFIEVALVTD